MRVFDQGSLYRVTCDVHDVREFKAHWPASGLPDRGVSFVFDKSTGDLVDMNPETLDGPAVVALSVDAQAYGRRRLNLD